VDTVAGILERVPHVPWFSAAERPAGQGADLASVEDYLQACGGGFALHWAEGWAEAARVVRGLDDASSFWRVEEHWRRQAVTAVDAAGRSEVLAEALHRLSVLGYDAVRPRAPDEELARVASGAALWTVAQAVTWATAADCLEPLANPFLPKLRLFERGHWPLGLWQGAIVVM
jgi:hypothetical protein